MVNFATLLHENDSNVYFCGVLGNYLVVDYLKSTSYPARRKTIMLNAKDAHISVLCNETGRINVRKCMHHIKWDFYKERCIVLEEPVPKTGFITVHDAGRYYQREAVEYVITQVLNSMKLHAKERGHEHNQQGAVQNLITAFQSSNLFCGCGQNHCDEQLQLWGPNKISPDRSNDRLDYGDDNQSLTIVVSPHNTRIKHTSVPTKRRVQLNWCSALAAGMACHTAERLEMLIANKPADRRSVAENNHVARFEWEQTNFKNPKLHRNHHLQTLLRQKYEQSKQCSVCGTDMYFGDSNGILRLAYVATQVSPDRIDNSNPWYDANNFRLTCVSCNKADRSYSRKNVIQKPKQPAIDLTQEVLQNIILNLNKRLLH